jgi:anti-sigma factor RsiW
MGIIALITELLKGWIIVLPELIAMIKEWRAYAAAIDARQKAAVASQVTAELKAQAEQTRKEQANQRAFLLVLDEAWKTRFNQVLACLIENRDADVLVMTESVDNELIDNILFHSDLDPEYKARKIVQIMRARTN